MKTKLKYILTAGLMLSTMFACDEQKFLKEEPLDFYTPDNSMQTQAQFQASTDNLYRLVRDIRFGGFGGEWYERVDAYFALMYATDFAVNATDYNPPVKLNDYKNTMVPTFSVTSYVWEKMYTVINRANAIITRAPLSTELADADKKKFEAQALFFRAYAYNFMANLYGGVPLLLGEVTAAKRNYTRATRDQVYEQCKKDLIAASQALGNIETVKNGEVNKQAVQHLLSEVYISLKDYDNAITTASAVINHPTVGLMKTRFGRHKDEPGDVYRDLFELNNQNRTSGNTEGLYVVQVDYQNASSNGQFNQGDFTQWAIAPNMLALTVKSKKDGSSKQAFKYFNGKICGNSAGWMRPTMHFLYEIWTPGDMRNSEYNIVRDFQLDHPDLPAEDFGKWYVKDGYQAKVTAHNDTIRNIFPTIRKCSISSSDWPDAYKAKDANGKFLTSPFGGNYLNDFGSSWAPRDGYLIRLAETYLLRAEAYIKKGNTAMAAADLNALRERAKAKPITAGEATIDFLLDERMRELHAEEFRMVTLCRMGLLYDRDKKYNEKSGLSIQPYHNLWPIPFSEINRNVDAVLTQNPGYVN